MRGEVKKGGEVYVNFSLKQSARCLPNRHLGYKITSINMHLLKWGSSLVEFPKQTACRMGSGALDGSIAMSLEVD